MKKKEKSLGAVFIMVIETSPLYFIYFFFFAQAFHLFYKDCFPRELLQYNEKNICSRLATKIIQKSKIISE